MKKIKILCAFLGTLILLSLLFGQGPLTILRLWDTNYTHYMDLKWNENDTSNRVLNFLVNSGSRSVTVEGNTVVDQDYSSDASPTFDDLTISTPSNIYGLSHDSFADYVAAKHYDWTNETHNFETTGTVIVRDPIIDVRSYDAVGDGSNDDTAEIQAAIDAVATAGGTVFFPEGTYLISDTIEGKSGVSLRGIKCAYGADSTQRGTWLKWGGSGAKGMLSLGTSSGGVQDVDVYGIGFDGQSDGDVIGIDIQSDNSPSTKALSIKRCFFLNTQKGIVVGGGSTNQNDNLVIDHCRFWSNPSSTMDTGIHINTSNCDFSVISNCAFYDLDTTAIYLQKCGSIEIKDCAAGLDANCKFIYADSVENVVVQNCQAESMGNFLYFAGSHSDAWGITLIGNVIYSPVELASIVKVVGTRNVWIGPDGSHTGTLTLNNAGAKYIGYGDNFELSDITITNGEFTNIRETSHTSDIKMHAGEIFYDPVNQAGDNNQLGLVCTVSGRRGDTWLAATAYSENDYVLPTHGNWNGSAYICSIAGTTDAAEPDWTSAPNVDDTVVDNTATWKNVGTAAKWSDMGQEFWTTSDTWDPASIGDGDEVAVDVTVPWAALGDFAMASFSLDVADLVLDAQVTAAHTVTAVLANNTGGAVDLGSGTLRVRVFKQ